MKQNDAQNLILFGFQSTGKTYFGKLLANELQKKFIDTDRLVEKLYQNKFHTILPCREIFNKIGEKGFRELETHVINDLTFQNDSIIALGGGVLLNNENYHQLKKIGRLIYLELDKNKLKERIFKRGVPSYLDEKNFDESFEQMFNQRLSIYKNVSSLKISISNQTDQEILEELKKLRFIA